MESVSILVTSIGSVAGDIVINSLKKLGFRIVGCDIYHKEWVANSLLVDAFYEVPYSNDDTYIDNIKNICINEAISYIIPLTDIDVDAFNRNRTELVLLGIKICISTEKSIDLARNKKAIADYIAINCPSVKIIETFYLDDNIPLTTFPMISKPVNGRSSQGKFIINDNFDFEYIKSKKRNEQIIVQPFIKGSIIAVDILREPRSGKVVVLPRCEILRTQHGCGMTVCVFYDKYLTDICLNLAELLDIEGCVNFEFIKDENDYYFMECNPRFSAGIAFSCASGYDFIKNNLMVFMGEDIEEFKLKKKYIISRKYKEFLMSSTDY